ncbi:hypothetical protein NKH77_44300 [Streptomyces sp. M19]
MGRAGQEIRPDVIYALLNWNSIPFLHRVFSEGLPSLRLPLQGEPFAAIRAGYWPLLRELVLNSDGRIFTSAAELDWLSAATDVDLDDSRTMILDGDLPKADWLAGPRSPRLSDADGMPHTVCVGRALTGPVREIARLGVHVHIYTHPYMRFGQGWKEAAESGADARVHLHGPISPARG